jgi:hypothetical protein
LCRSKKPVEKGERAEQTLSYLSTLPETLTVSRKPPNFRNLKIGRFTPGPMFRAFAFCGREPDVSDVECILRNVDGQPQIRFEMKS